MSGVDIERVQQTDTALHSQSRVFESESWERVPGRRMDPDIDLLLPFASAAFGGVSGVLLAGSVGALVLEQCPETLPVVVTIAAICGAVGWVWGGARCFKWLRYETAIVAERGQTQTERTGRAAESGREVETVRLAITTDPHGNLDDSGAVKVGGAIRYCTLPFSPEVLTTALHAEVLSKRGLMAAGIDSETALKLLAALTDAGLARREAKTKPLQLTASGRALARRLVSND